jgi:hypothetical protein
MADIVREDGAKLRKSFGRMIYFGCWHNPFSFRPFK